MANDGDANRERQRREIALGSRTRGPGGSAEASLDRDASAPPTARAAAPSGSPRPLDRQIALAAERRAVAVRRLRWVAPVLADGARISAPPPAAPAHAATGSTPDAPLGRVLAALAARAARQVRRALGVDASRGDTVGESRDAVHRCLTPDERLRVAQADDPRASLAGLALSGGGIRSATFALGVLQALGERGLLWMFDYLSTVSGGGYTGGWWSAWLSRPDARVDDRLFPADERLEPDRFPATLLDERNAPAGPPEHLPAGTPDGSRSAWLRDPIHHLRLFSNYLTPRKGALSGDTWRAAAVVSRNLLLTWLVLLPLLLAAVLTAQLYFAASDETAFGFACSRPDVVTADTVWWPGAATPTVRAVRRVARAQVEATRACRGAPLDGVRHGAVLRARLDRLTDPLFAALLVLGALTLLWMLYGGGSAPSTLVGFAALVGLVAPVMGLSGGDAWHPWTHFRVSWWFPPAALAAAAALVVGGLWAPLRTAYHNARDEARALAADPAGSARIRATPGEPVARDRVRNTIVRWHARVLVTTVVGLATLAVAGFGHELAWFLFAPGDGAVASVVRRVGGWGALLVSAGSGLFAVLRAGPSEKGKDAAPERPGRLASVAMSVAPMLVLVALVVGAATLGRSLFATMSTGAGAGGRALEESPLVTAALVGAALVSFFALFERWTSGTAGATAEPPRRRYGAVLGPPLVALALAAAAWRAGWTWSGRIDPAVPATALVLVGAVAVVRLRTTMPDARAAEWTTRGFGSSDEALRLDADVIPLEQQSRLAAHALADATRALAARHAAYEDAVRKRDAALAAGRLTFKLTRQEAALADAEAAADRAAAAARHVEQRLTEARGRRHGARRAALARFAGLVVPVAIGLVNWLWHDAAWPAATAALGPASDLALVGLAFCGTFMLLDLALSRRDGDRSVWLVVLVAAACGALWGTRLLPAAGEAMRFAVAGVALVALLLAWVIGLGWTADPNLLALHNFYKARLVRAYLGASNHEERRAQEITESAPHDDLPLKDLRNHALGAPVHVVNATLNLVGGRDLSTAQRFAATFTMSSEICGSARTGYHWTADYMGGALTLGTAVATSGAAVSANMGSKSTSSALALLLALFNVRLGLWAPTPNRGRWFERQPRLWPFYLLREALSQTNDLGTYCYLTDGGHFDNTGLYALVERGCRYILVLDDGADVAPCFSDVGEAIRRCRIDFGAEIMLEDGVTEFRKTTQGGLAGVHLVRGRIRYAESHLRMLGWSDAEREDPDGVVIWVKPVVTADDPVDVRQYKLENAAFPQQTTADQWYDESQFESYRALGYQSLAAAVDRMQSPPPQTLDDIPRFFANL